VPELSFQVEGAEVVRHGASPLLGFKLRIANADAEEAIQTIALRCQIQLETTKRRYSAEEQASLLDLFGEPERWGCCTRATSSTPTAPRR